MGVYLNLSLSHLPAGTELKLAYRKLTGASYPALVEQLKSGEVLFGVFERFDFETGKGVQIIPQLFNQTEFDAFDPNKLALVKVSCYIAVPEEQAQIASREKLEKQVKP